MDQWTRLSSLRECIGWNLPETVERLGLKPGPVTMSKLKAGSIEIPERDMQWLESVAEFIRAHPRPIGEPAARGMFPETLPEAFALAGAPVTSMPHPIGRAPAVPDDIREQAMETVSVMYSATIVRELVNQYIDAGSNELSEDQTMGARWAISQLAKRLEVLDELRAGVNAWSDAEVKRKGEMFPGAAPEQLASADSRMPF